MLSNINRLKNERPQSRTEIPKRMVSLHRYRAFVALRHFILSFFRVRLPHWDYPSFVNHLVHVSQSPCGGLCRSRRSTSPNYTLLGVPPQNPLTAGAPLLDGVDTLRLTNSSVALAIMQPRREGMSERANPLLHPSVHPSTRFASSKNSLFLLSGICASGIWLAGLLPGSRPAGRFDPLDCRGTKCSLCHLLGET